MISDNSNQFFIIIDHDSYIENASNFKKAIVSNSNKPTKTLHFH